MKKKFRIPIVTLLFLEILIIPFLSIYADKPQYKQNNMVAYVENESEIVDVGEHYILYKDNRLLTWINDEKKVYTDVEKVVEDREEIMFLKMDDTLIYKDQVIKENVEDFYFSPNYSNRYSYYYIDKEHNFYLENVTYSNIENEFIAENVENFIIYNHGVNLSVRTVLFKTRDNILYAIGDNYFGSKMNDGDYFSEPYKILSSPIKDYSEYLALTEEGQIYYFNSNSARPEVIAENVASVYGTPSWLGINYRNGKTTIKNGITSKEEIELGFRIKELKNFGGTLQYIRSTEDDFYHQINKYYFEEFKLAKFRDDIVDVQVTGGNNGRFYVLDDKGTLYLMTFDYKSGSELARALTKKTTYEAYEYTKLLEGVASIKYIDSNSTIIMKDGSIFRYNYDGSYVPSKLDDLLNDGKTIEASEIVLTSGDKEIFYAGEEWDMFATVVPHNAVSKKVKWTSSDETIAIVDETGYVKALKGGNVTICATVEAKSNVKACQEITVKTKLEGIKITNGEYIYVEGGETIKLTVEAYPKGAELPEITWTATNGNFMANYCVEDECVDYPNGEYGFFIEKGGAIVKVTAGEMSDTITITTDKDLRLIDLVSKPKEIYIGDNSPLVLEYKLYPENVNFEKIKFSSSDPNIASVSEDGIVTPLSPGFVTITLSSENANNSITIEVKDGSSVKKGDLDRNGSISISDVLEALFRIVDKKPTTKEDIQIADIDGDGKITISDAIAIIWLFIKD